MAHVNQNPPSRVAPAVRVKSLPAIFAFLGVGCLLESCSRPRDRVRAAKARVPTTFARPFGRDTTDDGALVAAWSMCLFEAKHLFRIDLHQAVTGAPFFLLNLIIRDATSGMLAAPEILHGFAGADDARGRAVDENFRRARP